QTFPPRQREILARYSDLVRPGGLLVYATCSINRGERGRRGRVSRCAPGIFTGARLDAARRGPRQGDRCSRARSAAPPGSARDGRLLPDGVPSRRGVIMEGKVVVTGASGNLGSAVCQKLHSEGARIVALVHRESSRAALAENLGAKAEVRV